MRTTIPAATLAAALLAALGTAPALAAGELYRWIEPDGSRTFSPTPPADDTPYTAVDPATLRPLGDGADAPEPAPPLASARVPAPGPVTPLRTAEPVQAPPAAVAPARAVVPQGDPRESARCTELRKRVVSLERRLTAPLTAEEMDETIVRMAAYQRSLESLCL